MSSTTTFAVSEDAQEAIAAASNRVASIGEYFGFSSAQYIEAARTWQHALSNLFGRPWADQVRVFRDGPAGSVNLLVTGGMTLGIIFHQATRHCTNEGCSARIQDDGTVWTFNTGDRVCASPNDGSPRHNLSWPLDAPNPGSWSTHS